MRSYEDSGASAVMESREGPPSGNSFIQVRDLVAKYEDTVAVRGVSFDVREGEQLTLLGPSGCGKTTTLRCIAGLETPFAGEIRIGGKAVYSSREGINVPSEKRQLSMVFQSYAIWPHMTVFQNVAYGLRLRGIKGVELRERVRKTLELVGMEEFSPNKATNLSGGQQQRVALARSYVFSPQALLLDEPLSNLDARLRLRMREELKDLQRTVGITTIYVTHDQEEAMALSDRVIVMKDGVVEQDAGPIEVYETPRTAFVADFIGAANVLDGEVLDMDGDETITYRTGDAFVQCVPPPDVERSSESEYVLAIRAAYVRLHRSLDASSPNVWAAQIVRRSHLGDFVEYVLTWPGGELRVRAFPDELFDEGEQVYISIPPEKARLVLPSPSTPARA